MTTQQLTPDLIAFISDMRDRTAINDCLLRYTRGVDRHDRELMLSAYWPDAVDQHGVAEGGADDFVDWALRTHAEQHTGHHHGTMTGGCRPYPEQAKWLSNAKRWSIPQNTADRNDDHIRGSPQWLR